MRRSKSWKPVLVRIGRFWPLVQIWSAEDEDKNLQISPVGKTIETISLEEALDCFKLPREVGKYEWELVIAAIWRFGPYVKYKDLLFLFKKFGNRSNVY